MNLRPARAIDAPALVALVKSRLPDTCYAGRDEVDEALARKLFAAAAFRHGQTNDGATFLMLAEDDAGEIAAFMFGSLSRVYGIGRKLCAADHFLLGRPDTPPRVLIRLFERYVAWASGNPRVIEIGASHSDVMAGSERMGAQYERMGFTLCARSYRSTNDPQSEARAA